MIFKLYVIELYKTRKRLLFWTVWLTTIALDTFVYGTIQGISGKGSNVVFEFPEAWPYIFTVATSISATLCGCSLVFLTAIDFDWRTVRQSLIDGISRYQWLSAKALLIPTLSLLYFIPQVIVGTVFAYQNSEIQSFSEMGLEFVHVEIAICVFFTFIGFLSIALLISVAVKSAVPAIITILLYSVFEGLISKGLGNMGLEMLSQILPLQVFKSFLLSETYTSSPGFYWSLRQTVILSIAWISVLLVGSYVVFLKRDQ